MEHSIRTGILWKFAGQVGMQSTRLVTVVVLAHLLAPADYGAAAIAVVLAGFAPTLADVGMGSALVQTSDETQAVRSTTFWSSIASGVALTALIIALANPVGRFLDDPRIGTMVAVGGLVFAFYSFGSTSQAMFMRTMNFRANELRYVLSLVVAGAAAITVAAAGLGAWALVVQQLVIAGAFATLLWWRAPWRPTLEFSRVAFRQLFAFAIRIAGGRIARLLELLLISLLIGKLVGIPELGTWAFGLSAVILPLTVIAVPIAEVLFSAFSRLQGERDRIATLWLDSVRVLAAVTLPLLAGLIVVSPDLIPLVFGSQWDVAVPVIQILSLYVMIRTLQAWNSIVLDAAGKPQVTLWTQVAALGLMPFAVWIGSRWGIEGVAACFVVAQLIAVEIPSFVCTLAELRLGSSRVFSRLWGIALATVAMAVACLAVRSALSGAGVAAGPRIVLTVAAGLIAYLAALWILAPDIPRRGITMASGALTWARGTVRRGRPA